MINVKDKFKNLLLNDCENWEHHRNGDVNLFYYNQNSDYHIDLSKEIKHSSPNQKLQEPFSLFYFDDEFSIGNAFFKIGNTTIFSCGYVYCDVEFPMPDIGFSDSDQIDNPDQFYYYLLDSLPGAFAYMLSPFECKGFEFPYIFFNNKEEMYDFSKFLKEFNEEIEVPKEYYPAMSSTAFELKNKNEFFRNTDLDSLRRNKYIYEHKYKKLK